MPVCDPVKNAVRRGGVALFCYFLEKLLGGDMAFVHPEQPVVTVVFDDVHTFGDRFEDFRRLTLAFQTAQGHVKPVCGGHQTVGSVRNFQTLAVGFESVVLLSREVIGQAEVISNVEVQRAGWNVARVGLAVGFDFIRFALNQLICLLKVADRTIEAPHSDVAMAAMPVEAGVRRKERDAFGVSFDGLGETAEIGEPASDPNDCVSTLRVGRGVG